MSTAATPEGYDRRLQAALSAVARGLSERQTTAILRERFGPISNLSARAYYQLARQARTAGVEQQERFTSGLLPTARVPLVPTLAANVFQAEVIVSVVSESGQSRDLPPLYVTMYGGVDEQTIDRAVDNYAAGYQSVSDPHLRIATWGWKITALLGGSGELV